VKHFVAFGCENSPVPFPDQTSLQDKQT